MNSAVLLASVVTGQYKIRKIYFFPAFNLYVRIKNKTAYVDTGH